MRVCLMIEGQESVEWTEWLTLARAAEAAGLDGFFRSDHYTSFHGAAGAALDAWSTVTGLAALTQRIRLGTLFDYEGKHYVLRGQRALPKPVQRPHPFRSQ